MTLAKASKPSSANKTSCPPCLRKISALRRMVLLSSTTSTLKDAPVVVNCHCSQWRKQTTHQHRVLKRLKSEPAQNLLCVRRILGKSNSWEPGPMECWVQCRAQANLLLRHISNRISDTSKFSSRSQLNGPSHRMQRLYLVISRGCSFCATLIAESGP